jgi:hypothetical protein
LIEAPAGARNPLEKLDVDLEAMPRLRFLVARPAVRVTPVFLVRRQPVHAVLAQNAMHRRRSDGEVVKPLQIIGNLARAEVIVLAEVEDFTDNVWRRRPRRAMRDCGSVGQSGITVGVVPLAPFVKRLPGNGEMPARSRHVPGVLGRLEELQAPVGQPELLRLCHRVSTLRFLA